MGALRMLVVVALPLWAGLLACAREVPSREAPVAVVAWLQGQASVVGVDGVTRPAVLESDLWYTDRLLLEDGAVVILGLFNNRVVKVDQGLRVRDLAALQLPADPRPVEVQLADLLDRTTLSARDDKQAQNSRIAGWHARRNAARTVTAQPARAKAEAQVAQDPQAMALPTSQPEAEPVAAARAELAADGRAELKPSETERDESTPLLPGSAAVAATKNEEAGRPLQAPTVKLQAPASPKVLQLPAKDSDQLQGEAAGAGSGGTKSAPGPDRSEPETDAVTNREKPVEPRAPVKARVRAVPGAELLLVEGTLPEQLQIGLLRALASSRVLACLRGASDEETVSLDVELQIEKGTVTSFRLLKSGKAVSCERLLREAAKQVARLRSKDPSQSPPSGTLRARVSLR